MIKNRTMKDGAVSMTINNRIQRRKMELKE
jgi:hypothetical protein